MARAQKIGILGGTFDPIHDGHLAVARAAKRRFGLDRVLLIPCGLPPHKSARGLTPFLHRFAMVALACKAGTGLVASAIEGGPDLTGRRINYTAETMTRLRKLYGRTAKLYFVLGADQFAMLPKWKSSRRLVRQCEFIVAARKGYAAMPQHPGVTAHVLRMPPVRISARDIRAAVRAGRRGWRRLVPRDVADYIEAAGLYRVRGRGRLR